MAGVAHGTALRPSNEQVIAAIIQRHGWKPRANPLDDLPSTVLFPHCDPPTDNPVTDFMASSEYASLQPIGDNDQDSRSIARAYYDWNDHQMKQRPRP